MLRKRSFDTRDALEILRDVFSDSPSMPRVAELGRKPKTRVVMTRSSSEETPEGKEQLLREDRLVREAKIKEAEMKAAAEEVETTTSTILEGQVPAKPEELSDAERIAKTHNYNADELKAAYSVMKETGTTMPGYNDATIPEAIALIEKRNKKETVPLGIQQPEPQKQTLHTLDEKTARAAIEQGLQNISSTQKKQEIPPLSQSDKIQEESVKTLKDRVRKLEEQKASLLVEDQKTLDALTRQIEAQFEMQDQTEKVPKAEYAPPSPDADKQMLEVLPGTVPEETHPKPVAPEPSLVPSLPKTPETKLPQEPVPTIEKSAVPKQPAVPPPPDLSTLPLEDIEKQLAESEKKTVGAALKTHTPPAPPEKQPISPELPPAPKTPEPPSKETAEKEETEKIARAWEKGFKEAAEEKKKESEKFEKNLKPEKEQYKEKIGKFEEKTEQLRKEVESGATPQKEKLLEVLARQTAKDAGYDLEKIDNQLAYLNKPENKKGVNLLKITRWELARKLVADEIGTVSAKEKKEPKHDPNALRKKLHLDKQVSPSVQKRKKNDKDVLKRKFGLGEYERKPKKEKEEKIEKKPYTINVGEATRPVSTTITQAFEKRLGIAKEDLEKESIFASLTEGQQFLVLQDLEQLALGRVQAETQQKLAKQQTPDATWNSKIWNSVSEAIKGTGKKYRVEKQLATNITKGGMQQHGDTLRLLSAEMNPNLEVVPQEDGTLEVRYISFSSIAELLGKLPAKERDRGMKYMETLNTTASEFRTVPRAWSSDNASRIQRRAYEKNEKRFHEAESAFLSFVSTYTRTPLERAKYELLLAQTEHAVQQEQFFNTHPEARIQLETMTDKKWFTRYLKDVFRERAIFMATGSVARTATIGVASVASLPLTAAAIGGVMAGRALLRGHIATKQGREALIHKARAQRETTKEGTEMRDYAKSEALNTGFEKILKKLTTFDARDNTQPLTTGERKEKEHALKQLERILHIAQDRRAADAITYSSSARALPEHFRLGRNISMAEKQLVTAPLEGFKSQSQELRVDDRKVDRTIENVWALRKGRMANERKAYLRKQALVQGGINTASGAFGMWIADTLELGPKFQNALEKLMKKTGSLSGIDIDYLLKEYGPRGISKPVEDMPRGPGRTVNVLEQADESIQNAKLAAGRVEAAAALTETEFAARKAEAAVRAGTSVPPENLPIGKVPKFQTVEDLEKKIADSSIVFPRSGTDAAAEKTLTFSVDKRGPEGAIIDAFKRDTKLAEQFGWNGKGDMETWVGSKAHTLWLEDAKEAIKKPDLLEQMKKLGYLKGLSKQDMNDETILLGRYKEMMHHLKRGSSLLITPNSKELDFSKLVFLKARK